MMKKMALLIGIGIGYVLGSRAGRGRYEQLAGGATKLWNSDPVQQAAGQAQDLAVEATARAGHIAAEATERAGHAVKDTAADVRDAAKSKLHDHQTS